MTGLQHRDMGEWRCRTRLATPIRPIAITSSGEIGLVLRDWRYVARIANIDVTQLTGVSAANLINLLVRALYRLPTALRLAPRRFSPPTPGGSAPTWVGR